MPPSIQKGYWELCPSHPICVNDAGQEYEQAFHFHIRAALPYEQGSLGYHIYLSQLIEEAAKFVLTKAPLGLFL